MFHSIRWRIALPYIALILAAALGLGLYLSSVFRTQYLADLNGQLLGEARLVAESVAPALQGEASGEQLSALARRNADLTGARVTVIGFNGVVLADSLEDPARMDNHLYRVEVQEALKEGSGSNVRYSLTLGYELLYVAVPVQTPGQEPGVVRLALPLEPIQRHLNRLRQAIVVAALLTALGAAVLAVLVADRITRPLRKLMSAIRRMEAGDLSARVLPTTRDEIGELCLAFDEMAGRQRETVDELSNEKNRLATILQNTVNGILITDRDGRVTLINPAAERMLEADGKAAMGQSFAQVARHHKIIETWRRCADERKTQAESVDVEARGLFLQVIAVPLDGGDVESCLMILQDLSQVRRLEMVRRDFVGNVSHELKTPLASVRALVDTLRDGALEDPQAAPRFLEQLDGQVDDLTRIVEELLELARIESGNAGLKLAPESVDGLVQAALERLAPQLERNSIVIATQIPEGLPKVLCERGRLEQVLVNLLHNAIKFTSVGGRVDIRVQSTGSEVTISVADTGVGIASEDLPRIFERFYKTDRARATGGTGLGLAISKHIILAHGGRIWVQSTLGKGSTFAFTLPGVQSSD